MYTYKPKPKLTKSDVVNNRLKGLKHFDKACKLIPRSDIIKRAIELSKDPIHSGIAGIGKDNTWAQFEWGFGNAWREVLNAHNLSASFNLDEALTLNEMNFIANEIGITESYIGTWPRAI